MSLKEKIATLLDVLADNLEFSPEVTTDDPLAKFAMTYREITGEEMSSTLRTRLEEDETLREAFTKVSAQTPQRPTPLGEPADTTDQSPPLRSKEAAEREAYDRFAQGIIAIGQR